jgi:transposase
MIAKLDAQVEEMMEPFRPQRELLITIPGIGQISSAVVISEIGDDVAAYFPTAEQLASWTGLCPGNHESAGKRYRGKRRKGNQHLQPWLVECAWAAVRTDGYLREFYRRQVRVHGGFRSPTAKKKAIVAVAHKLAVIIWHVLATGRPYEDLGADYFTTRIDPEKEKNRLVAKLEAQGYTVTLEPAAMSLRNTHRHNLTRLRCTGYLRLLWSRRFTYQTPESRSTRWHPRSPPCRRGRWWRRSSTGNVARRRWPIWPRAGCARRFRIWRGRWKAASATIMR